MHTIRKLFVLCVVLIALLPHQALSAADTSIITIIGFSDYHSHAVPFYSEGAANQAGIARTIAYLKTQRAADPNLLVLSGGDMMNKGAPTWSDEYQCAEWPWFNGLVDAMAIGNHEFDYGAEVFKKCHASVNFPILSANLLGADGNPILLSDSKPYLVKSYGDIKIGAFSLADSDFNKLIKPENLPVGSTFGDRVATATQIVDTLRNTEKVNMVILFGHAYRESDTALVQAVPGIDLVLGTHSHYKGEFTKLPNTETYYISPFQYLTYLSRVEVTFMNGTMSEIKGELVKMDAERPEDPEIAADVVQKQTALEAKYPDKFKVLGQAAVELSDHNISTDESVLGNWALDTVRADAGVNAFFNTASSFRAAIPPGPITVEAFYTAIPYKNAIVTAEMNGQQVLDLVNLSLSKRGTDSFSQLSGLRFKMQDGKAAEVQILADPADATKFEALDLAKTYKIGTTDFQALVSGVYKDAFAKASNVNNTNRDFSTILTDKIQKDGTVTGALDGRMGNPAPMAKMSH